MEQERNLTEQSQKSLQEYSPTTLSKQDRDEISVYKPGVICQEVLSSGVKMIAQAFPKLPSGWFVVLKNMLKDEGFDDKRFSDAVKSLVKNCVYPEPTIANIISFDRTVKVFTISDLRQKHKDAYYFGATYDPIVKEYSKIDFYGQERYARKEDVQQYNLELWPEPVRQQAPVRVYEMEEKYDGKPLSANDLVNALKPPSIPKLSDAEKVKREKIFQEILRKEKENK